MKLLVAYDGSGYSHAALSDLRRAGLPEKADVLMVSVCEVWLPPETHRTKNSHLSDNDTWEYFQKHSEQLDRNLSETEKFLIEAKDELQKQFPHWTIETEALAGSPSQVILERSARFEPDLVAVGPKGLSSDRGIGLGSVSQTVLSYSQNPVRICRGNAEKGAHGLKIAIGFDSSACSLDAVKAAAERDWQRNTEFRIFVVTDPIIPLIPGRTFQVMPGALEFRMKGEENWINTLAAEALDLLGNYGLKASLHMSSGNPRIMLVHTANEWKADTIFVGKNSRRSNLLGCVASAVAQRASCSVEVIPTMQRG